MKKSMEIQYSTLVYLNTNITYGVFHPIVLTGFDLRIPVKL